MKIYKMNVLKYFLIILKELGWDIMKKKEIKSFTNQVNIHLNYGYYDKLQLKLEDKDN